MPGYKGLAGTPLPGCTWLDRTSRIRLLLERGNLAEAAMRLFDLLHELDKIGVSVIRVEWVPEAGPGAAINDRLSRAAARTKVSRTALPEVSSGIGGSVRASKGLHSRYLALFAAAKPPGTTTGSNWKT
ncbi:hypothetical protein Holit_03250 [Hollandina sp. SP2]